MARITMRKIEHTEPIDGPQLGEKQVGTYQTQTNPSHTQEGVVFLRQIEIGNLFIAADI